jgi:hypothetical protein
VALIRRHPSDGKHVGHDVGPLAVAQVSFDALRCDGTFGRALRTDHEAKLRTALDRRRRANEAASRTKSASKMQRKLTSAQ